jgi:hypothetical protein
VRVLAFQLGCTIGSTGPKHWGGINILNKMGMDKWPARWVRVLAFQLGCTIGSTSPKPWGNQYSWITRSA